MGARVGLHHDAGGSRDVIRYGVPMALVAIAALGWWWSLRASDDMSGMGAMGGRPNMSLAGFMLAWLTMMAAMMLPAISPVVKLYARAAAHGRVAPLPFFVTGYLLVWVTVGYPAYFAWRGLEMPLADGQRWVAWLTGSVFIGAALWQLSPIKSLCLKHCRSPLSFFMRFGSGIRRPLGATRMGMAHGMFCLGCCWTMFAVLVAVGTMHITWMLLLTVIIVVEKNFRHGETVAALVGVAFAAIGLSLVIWPSLLQQVT